MRCHKREEMNIANVFINQMFKITFYVIISKTHEDVVSGTKTHNIALGLFWFMSNLLLYSLCMDYL